MAHKQQLQQKRTMKNKNQSQEQEDLEILKAVAQAWHGHSSSSRTTKTTSEFDAHRRYFKGQPTRFKIEAMKMKEDCGKSWDFGQSLWDSYEILSISTKLERGLVMDNPFSGVNESVKRRKESKNSLRNLFNMVPSRRFSQVPGE